MDRPKGDQRFIKAARLTHRAEFLHVQKNGKKAVFEPLVALAVSNGTRTVRAGFTVSSKVGNAIVRARIRRQLRELFRKRREELPDGVDVVFIARAAAKGAAFEELARAYAEVARRLKRSFP